MNLEKAIPFPPSRLLGKQVIVLAGATSVGKSAVAAELCKIIDAEIVLADCVQVRSPPAMMFSDYHGEQKLKARWYNQHAKEIFL
jgi:MinD superfamily P-loop ATPase